MTFRVRPIDNKDIPFWELHYGGRWGYLINVFSAPSGLTTDNRMVAFVGQDGYIYTTSVYNVITEVN